jgi:hypothetical protein
VSFHNLIEFNSTKLWKEFNWNKFELNWMWLNSIKISMKTLIILNPKEKNIVFSSIHFNLRIWIELNSNSIELHSIQIALCKFIQYQIIQMKLNFYIVTFVDMCSVFFKAPNKAQFSCQLGTRGFIIRK